MKQTRAYNELLSLLLSPMDQQAFEWAVGSMLNDGPPVFVVFRGDAATGKTTLTNIVRKLIAQPLGNISPRVAFLPDNQMYETRVDDDMFVFAEVNDMRPLSDDMIVIHTTGNRVPVNKHHVLMDEIDNELPEIARGCSAVYSSLGENYNITNLENNR